MQRLVFTTNFCRKVVSSFEIVCDISPIILSTYNAVVYRPYVENVVCVFRVTFRSNTTIFPQRSVVSSRWQFKIIVISPLREAQGRI